MSISQKFTFNVLIPVINFNWQTTIYYFLMYLCYVSLNLFFIFSYFLYYLKVLDNKYMCIGLFHQFRKPLDLLIAIHTLSDVQNPPTPNKKFWTVPYMKKRYSHNWNQSKMCHLINVMKLTGPINVKKNQNFKMSAIGWWDKTSISLSL